MLKVCIIKESLCIGGTERSAANISCALSEQHEVYMLLFNESIIDYPYGGTLIGLHTPPRPSRVGKVWNSLIRAVRQRKFLLNKKIDIAFLFTGIHGYAVGAKMPYCKKIISCRDFKGLEEACARFDKALGHSDAIVFNSKYQRDYFIRHYPKQVDKSFAVYNIIDTEQIRNQACDSVEQAFSDFVQSHDHTIVSVGRFCAEKGFENLLETFHAVHNNHPKIGLVLVGEGDLHVVYDKIIAKYNLQQDVYFTGFQSNPYKYIAKCTLFVLSSLSEGFPNVVPEAMACGLPVICSNCLTGPAEILLDKSDYDCVKDAFIEADYGLLTPAFSGELKADALGQRELARAIEYMILSDDRMNRYKELSLKRAEHFSKTAALKEFNKVFNYVLGGNLCGSIETGV